MAIFLSLPRHGAPSDAAAFGHSKRAGAFIERIVQRNWDVEARLRQRVDLALQFVQRGIVRVDDREMHLRSPGAIDQGLVRDARVVRCGELGDARPKGAAGNVIELMVVEANAKRDNEIEA